MFFPLLFLNIINPATYIMHETSVKLKKAKKKLYIVHYILYDITKIQGYLTMHIVTMDIEAS